MEANEVCGAPEISYSLEIMEEIPEATPPATGIDLGYIVDSEILDKIPSSRGRPRGRPRKNPPPPSPLPALPPKTKNPPSYLLKALLSFLHQDGGGNRVSPPGKHKKSPQKYPQHDIPPSFFNRRLVSRLPLNLYEKFRQNNNVNALPTTAAPEDNHEVSDVINDREEDISNDSSGNNDYPIVEFADFLPIRVESGSSNSELDQFYNQKKDKYDCAFCKSVFKYKGTLKRHLLVKHTSGDGVIDFTKGGKNKKVNKKPTSTLIV